jgi:transposase-like protein
MCTVSQLLDLIRSKSQQSHSMRTETTILPPTRSVSEVGMAWKNRTQFQSGLSLACFIERYGTEEACGDALASARWPEGFTCARCEGRAHRVFRRLGQRIYQCNACGRQVSLCAGTLLAHTHVPLQKWFLAVYLLAQSKTNLSALELMRHLGVSYNAAWRIKHKLMQLMANAESQRKLFDFVQIDDAYLGGERTGSRPGRGSENKVPIVVAVSTTEDGRPRQAVITPIASFSKRAIAEWAACHLDSACEVYTDGLSAFDALEERGHPRTLMVTEGRRTACVAPGANWVNTPEFRSYSRKSLICLYHDSEK